MRLNSLLDHIKEEIAGKYDIGRDSLQFLKINNGTNRGSITLLLFKDGRRSPSFFVKASNRANTKDFINNESVALRKLSGISDKVPNPVSFFEHGPFSILITEFIEGRSLHDMRIGAKPVTARVLDRDLTEINKELFKIKTGCGVYARRPLAELLDDIKTRYGAVYGGGDLMISYLKKIDGIFASQLNMDLDLYVNHGDFAIGHLITDGKGIKGIVDWEYFGKIVLPFFDINYCCLTYFFYIINPTMEPAKFESIHPVFFDLSRDLQKTFYTGLKEYFELYHVPYALIPLFFFYSIAESLLRVKTIIGVPDDDPRPKALRSFCIDNIEHFLVDIKTGDIKSH